jgi:phage portal protein BeeE
MVATVYGVPPQLVNVPGGDTYNNMQEAKLALWQDTIIPHLGTITDALTRWLAPKYKGEGQLKVCYDEDAIPAIQARRQEKYKALEGVTFLTDNEKRTIMGLEPVTGGDTIFKAANQLPLEMLTDDNPPGQT